MFRYTKEPSSGGENLCIAKLTRGSVVLVRVKSVSIVAAHKLLCVCVYVCMYGSLCLCLV